MNDAVDLLMTQWARERPDLDVWPMGIMGRISRLSRLLDRELKEFFAPHGLERWEFDVLATLRRSGPPYELTAGALNKAAMVTSGAITNRIDRMAARGLVERIPDSGDRRSVLVRLTERGLALVDEVLEPHVANEARLLASLDPRERDHLAAALRSLLASLGDTTLG
ncbi:MarR family winged helix-turn-helix transcriptional regulator [Microbispora bryophytorum]|uniref:MarR family transcriptional regulator n=1 Tax=Microbispora bryophytorum TaxID=1460882 RepID=A0A8H9H0T9_9ACTN|nr:MarR family transcriptional regulator [Microbispora bryophytorum]MBD3136560.1 MarR family transcriptional regulator [Microbispora bryophytorum]TQS06159.1 MarR family transcriptional regulator [Microbispora bryophytorum]GGO18264.1 MarR family transcriptional regulator [Microbispora bryophytorum]